LSIRIVRPPQFLDVVHHVDHRTLVSGVGAIVTIALGNTSDSDLGQEQKPVRERRIYSEGTGEEPD
jgi:hypothetical protein